jgi:hypothetical protein
MAEYLETEILTDGCKLKSPTKGSFAMNMLFRRGAWEVRKGFGQFAQRSSSFGLPSTAGNLPFSPAVNTSLETHLGSHLMMTNFGHEQVVSVFSGIVNTADIAWAPNTRPGTLNVRVYTVHIDDLTDGTHWEVPLYNHTVDQKDEGITEISTAFEIFFTEPLAEMHGNYETDIDLDRQSWAWANAGPQPFTFQEYQDVVLMGHPDAGLWAYLPGTFQDFTQRGAPVTHAFWHESAPPYAESSMVVQLPMAGKGQFSDEGLTYLIPSDFPGPAAMAIIKNVVIYARGRDLYFSDQTYVASVRSDNVARIVSEYPITAIAEQVGNLTIFTEKETFVYRPPEGAELQSGGSITKLSDSIGCLNPNSVVKVENALIWMDANGVYRTTGNLIITPISDDIAPYFTDFVTNPMTSYFVESGTSTPVATADANTPDTTLKLNADKAHMAFSPSLNAVFAVFPEEREMWVLSEGKWAYWSMESSVHVDGGGNPDVQVTRRIQSPWIVTGLETIAMLSGPIPKTNTDTNPSFQVATIAADYQLLVYGRGGALDRSVDDEDMSVPSQAYFLAGAGGAQGRIPTHQLSLYIDKPFRVHRGYKFPGGEPVINTKEVWWVPIKFSSPAGVLFPANGVSAWNIGLAFDSTNWKPILIVPGATGDIDFQVPSERVGSAAGYAYGAGAAGTRVTQTAASTITIEFTNPGGPIPIVFNDDRVTPLLYVPMERLTATGVRGMGFVVTTACRFSSAGAVNQLSNVLVWNRWFRGTPDAAFENNVARPVDWCYKSGHVGLEDDKLLKARGLFTRLLSHGNGTLVDALEPGWGYGHFNVLLGCDRKGWMSQVVDFNVSAATGDNALFFNFNKNTTRLRVRDVAGTMLLKNFAAGPGSPGLTYGQAGVAGGGDYLIDDEEVSIIATSDSVKGGSFSYMVFGFFQNRAQALKIESIMAELRVLGGSRRRTGRS